MLNKIIKYKGEIWAQETVDSYVKNRNLENIIGCSRSDVYEDYLEYCRDNHITPLSTYQFMFRMNKKYGTTTKVIRSGEKLIRVVVGGTNNNAQS